MLDTKERPPLGRAAIPAVPVCNREQPENNPTARRLQHLKAARQLGDEARLRLYQMEEHLHAAGVDIDDFAAKEDVKEVVRDLNRLIAAGGNVTLLREAIPAYVREAIINLREERERRGLR